MGSGRPAGWVSFGVHSTLDYCHYTGALEFSEEKNASGMPKWERHDGCRWMPEPAAALVAKVHNCPDCTHAKPEPPPTSPCEWFSWIGGSCCERCGGSLDQHRGIEWISPDGGPFDIDGPTVQVEWKDYGPGRVLNVPLLTLYMPEGALEYLQTKHQKASTHV